jgi:hypothetical protein
MAERLVPESAVKEIVDFNSILERFIAALNEGGYFVHDSRQAIRDAMYILEKPWKYQDEMAKWEALGYPDQYNPDYIGDLEIDISDAQILSFFKR